MAQRAARMSTFGLVVSTITSLAVAQAVHAETDAQAGTFATTGVAWGIDTVAKVQSGNILTQTKSALGNPRFVHRYLIYSTELSSTEAYLARRLFPPGTWPNVDVDEFSPKFTRMLWA